MSQNNRNQLQEEKNAVILLTKHAEKTPHRRPDVSASNPEQKPAQKRRTGSSSNINSDLTHQKPQEKCRDRQGSGQNSKNFAQNDQRAVPRPQIDDLPRKRRKLSHPNKMEERIYWREKPANHRGNEVKEGKKGEALADEKENKKWQAYLGRITRELSKLKFPFQPNLPPDRNGPKKTIHQDIPSIRDVQSRRSKGKKETKEAVRRSRDLHGLGSTGTDGLMRTKKPHERCMKNRPK